MTGRERRRSIVLALGNDVRRDDGVGLAAARLLKGRVPAGVDVVEAGAGGFHLFDHLEGYDRALLIDAIATGKHPPGTVLEYAREDFARVAAPSPHYAGLPEILALADTLKLDFPKELRILAMEVEHAYEFGTELTPPVQAALPAFVDRAAAIVAGWGTEAGNGT